MTRVVGTFFPFPLGQNVITEMEHLLPLGTNVITDPGGELRK